MRGQRASAATAALRASSSGRAGIRVDDVSLTFRGARTDAGARRHLARRRARRGRRPHRPQRLRQEHAAAGPRRAASRRTRARSRSTAGRSTGPDPRVGLVFQEPRLLAVAAARRQRRVPARARRLAARPSRRARAAELLGLVGLREFAGAKPSDRCRAACASGCDRAGARARARGPAARRAVQRPRRADPRAAQRGAAGAVAADRDDDRARHPQHPRGRVPRRPGRRAVAATRAASSRTSPSTCRGPARLDEIDSAAAARIAARGPRAPRGGRRAVERRRAEPPRPRPRRTPAAEPRPSRRSPWLARRPSSPASSCSSSPGRRSSSSAATRRSSCPGRSRSPQRFVRAPGPTGRWGRMRRRRWSRSCSGSRSAPSLALVAGAPAGPLAPRRAAGQPVPRRRPGDPDPRPRPAHRPVVRHRAPEQARDHALIVFFPVADRDDGRDPDRRPRAARDGAQLPGDDAARSSTRVEIPAALPSILGGMRVGATLAVIGAIVAEWAGGESRPRRPDQHRPRQPVRHPAHVRHPRDPCPDRGRAVSRHGPRRAPPGRRPVSRRPSSALEVQPPVHPSRPAARALAAAASSRSSSPPAAPDRRHRRPSSAPVAGRVAVRRPRSPRPPRRRR